MSIAVLIIILVICLLLEGFFSGSEMALVNADKYRLAIGTDSGSRRALSALHMVKNPAKFFSTTLLGTNLCTVAGSVVTTFFIIDRFGPEYSAFAILYWPFTLVLGEIVPKSVYQYYADKIVLRVSPILLAVSVILHPVIWLLSKLTESLLGGVKRRHGVSHPISREELELILEVGRTDASDVKQAERTMISRIFNLAERRVSDIMTPLVDVAALPVSAGREDVERLFEKQGYSRVPVFDGRVINIVGVISSSDLMFGDEKAGVKDIMKPVYYVPEEMPLDELLVTMKRKGEPLAVAVDEYGGAAGIVTAEDLLEEVVGDIEDEHDEAAPLYARIGWHHYMVSGRMEVSSANEKLKLNIPDGDYKTIAGFVVHSFERIPKAGEAFRFGRFLFTVSRATDRAVQEVEIVQVLGSEDKDQVKRKGKKL